MNRISPNRFWMVLATLLICLGCQQVDTAQVESKNEMPVVVKKANIQNQIVDLPSAKSVRYTIALPPGFDPDKPTPLVVGLHYGGEVSPHYARGFVDLLVQPGLADLNAIIVAPDSIARGWGNDKNETMVLELMDFVKEQYQVDPQRILLTGFSMGGHGTWYVGSRNQDKFTAMVPIAGAPQVAEDTVWTTPVHAIHSSADTVVPIQATKDYVAQQNESGNDLIELTIVPDIPHYQTGSFAEPLKSTVPWIKQVWEKTD